VAAFFTCLEKLALVYPDLEFILPVHPHPNIVRHLAILKTVKHVPPLSYVDCITTLAGCLCVITDSGGIQEEASFLQKRIIVCRKTTERQELLGVYSTLCPDFDQLGSILHQIVSRPQPDTQIFPYGKGDSCIKIVQILATL
jgi:UDP-N-acetylglucosamine 2-epimerase